MQLHEQYRKELCWHLYEDLTVTVAFVKGVNVMPSVFKHQLAFLLFDYFSLFCAAIVSLNSFIHDSYCSEGHTNIDTDIDIAIQYGYWNSTF